MSGPVHVAGEVITSRKAGAYRVLTIVAPVWPSVSDPAPSSRSRSAGRGAVAETNGVRSQLALERPLTCATGLCDGCPVPVVGDDGTEHVVRACVDGPVFRGDRVRWEEL